MSDTEYVNIWQELIDNWVAVNNAKRKLREAKNELQTTYYKLRELKGGRVPEQMVVLYDENRTYIVESSVDDGELKSIRGVQRRNVWSEDKLK